MDEGVCRGLKRGSSLLNTWVWLRSEKLTPFFFTLCGLAAVID